MIIYEFEVGFVWISAVLSDIRELEVGVAFEGILGKVIIH